MTTALCVADSYGIAHLSPYIGFESRRIHDVSNIPPIATPIDGWQWQHKKKLRGLFILE